MSGVLEKSLDWVEITVGTLRQVKQKLKALVMLVVLSAGTSTRSGSNIFSQVVGCDVMLMLKLVF